MTKECFECCSTKVGVGRNDFVGNNYITVSSHRNAEAFLYIMFFHLLGRYNEHQRPDRDAHIGINWENIIPGLIQILYRKTCMFMTIL